ncbi:TPA: hypothetical protein GXZ54_04960 [bacterium]|nr:hypothetical protein [bacterium]
MNNGIDAITTIVYFDCDNYKLTLDNLNLLKEAEISDIKI